MALEDLTDFDKINIGAALLTQLDIYKEHANDNSRRTGDPEWDNYWDDRVKETIETINRFQPGLLDKD